MNANIVQLSDLDLVAQVRAGRRDLFGEIVRRHQALVCGVAYAVCGDFARSEDVAQEAFVTAWRQLGELQDGTKFKAWLCTIARRLALRAAEKQRRPADAHAAPMEAGLEAHDPSPSPHEHAAAREEAALVWAALEEIPGDYREPLVLFYREGQSVARVAEALEIEEDAAKQRLSRGRTMLREQVAALIEGTLERTRPGRAFTLAVLAALPGAAVTTASAATIATAAKGSVAAKAAATAAGWGGLIGGLSGLLGATLGTYASAQSATYERERRHVWRRFRVSLLLVVIFMLPLTFLARPLGPTAAAHPRLYAGLLVGWIVAFVVALQVYAWRVNREIRRIHAEEKAAGTPELPSNTVRRFLGRWEGRRWRTRATLLGLPLIHVNFGPIRSLQVREAAVARGWIAIGDRAYGVLFALGNIACGAISVGGVSVGLVSVGGVCAGGLALGGLSVGAISFGGLALGGLAFGGLALGWEAFGGGAIAWRAAFGGLAWAHDYAVGGSAFAAHANDAVARTFIGQNWFFQTARWLAEEVIVKHQTAFMIYSFAFSLGLPLLLVAICYRFKRVGRGGGT